VLNDKLDARLQELIKQWNIAEGRIKQAENVRAQEIVSSAIYELRYAGRKTIDAIYLVLTTDWQNDDELEGPIRAYIEDAIEDCIKAKHDAIDAALSFVTRWLAEQEIRIGLKYIQQFYPNYLEIVARIADIQEEIEESRRNRTEKRDSIYDKIDVEGYDAILKLYRNMMVSRNLVDRTIRKDKIRDNVLLGLGIAGAVGLIVAVLDLYFHLFPIIHNTLP